MGCTITISFDPDTTTVRTLFTIFNALEDINWYQGDMSWGDTGITIYAGDNDAEEVYAYFRANKTLRDLDLDFKVEDW